MIKRFIYFLKLFIQLICWVCVVIAAIGAVTTDDTFFKVCGVIAIVTLAYNAYRYISTHSGGIAENE